MVLYYVSLYLSMLKLCYPYRTHVTLKLDFFFDYHYTLHVQYTPAGSITKLTLDNKSFTCKQTSTLLFCSFPITTHCQNDCWQTSK